MSPDRELDTGRWKGVKVAGKSYSAEQIINHLRQAEILIAEGRSIREAARQIGVTARTYYR
jgi:hypothetical protein